MPYGEVRLIPGVNTERTPTLLETGISVSSLVRFKDALVQKLGGWMRFYQNAVPGIPRDLHAWQDLNQIDHLAIGTTTQLGVITDSAYRDITPQTLLSNFAPDFTTVMGSPTVTVTDPNISNVTIYDSVLFNTPVSVDGIILSGLYAIVEITGADSYDITAATNAVSGVTSEGAVPVFTTGSGSAVVNVLLPAHDVTVGETVVFPIATTGNGVTIQGGYEVASVTDVDNFSITVANQATGGGSFSMNGGDAELLYYINIGPAAVGSGYGLGGYGDGGYGTGTSPSQQTGTEITATDWTQDNWGQILLSCPAGGGVYQFDPTGGFGNAGLVSSAPPFNAGIFVSTSEEILICYGSTVSEAIGIEQDPLLVKWSTIGDYTNFVPLTTDSAGDFRIAIGSKIVTGASATNENLLWTDTDLWAMNFVGGQDVFGFNRIGVGAGAVSSHAVQPLRGNFYWMGPFNFYVYDSNGVRVLPCPVWDAVFQNINMAFLGNVRALPNTPFNEAGWSYPSAASTDGECDSYVKMNITDPGAPWDYGPIDRSAWVDQTVLGMPIGASSGGIVYQHETSPDADGQPLAASFTTGYFYIAEGEDFAFIDQLLPDFKWQTFPNTGSSAQVQLTLNVINYPGDAPQTFGPFTVNSGTEFISLRARGRQASFTIASDDLGSFWRLGKIRYRYAPCGRR